MEVIIKPDADAVSKEAARWFRRPRAQRSTGAPGFDRDLAEAGQIDFAGARSFNLEE